MLQPLLPYAPPQLDGTPAVSPKAATLSAFQVELRRARHPQPARSPASTTFLPAFDPTGALPTEALVDELSWTSQRVVWSRGGTIHRSFSYESEQQPVVQALFAIFDVAAPIQPVASTSKTTLDDTTFGPFRPAGPPAWTEDPLALPIHPTRAAPQPEPRAERCLVVFLSELAFAYPASGGSVPFQLPFHLHRAWPMHRGVLLERTGRDQDDLPTLYSLLGPKDEIKVVAASASLDSLDSPCPQHDDGEHEPVQNLADRLVFVSDRTDGSQPVLVTANAATGKLAVWAYAAIPQSLEDESTPGQSPSASPSSSKKGKEREGAPAAPTTATTRSKRKRSSVANTSLTADRSHSGRRASLQNPNATAILGEQDLLEALGETMGTAMKRTASAMSAIAAADRRGSVTRNELSLTMDRMALGTALGVGVGQAGAGDMDREATLLIGDSEESRMVSDVFVAKVCEMDLALPGSRAFDDATAHMFDTRGGSSTLAIHLPSSATVLLLAVSYSSSGKLVLTPLRQTTAVACTPVIATRANVLDLLVLSPTGTWSALTASAVISAALLSPVPSARRIVRLDGNRTAFFTLTLDDGTRLSSALRAPPSGLARRMLHAISLVVPLDDFVPLQRAVENGGVAQVERVLQAFFGVEPLSRDPADVWGAFENMTARYAQRDPAIATLRASPTSQARVAPNSAPVARRELREAVVSALHLLAEDCKLHAKMMHDHVRLVQVMLPLVASLGNQGWTDAYLRRTGGALPAQAAAFASYSGPTTLPPSPPDLMSKLSQLLAGRERASALSLSALAASFNLIPSLFYGAVTPTSTTTSVLSVYEALSPLSGPASAATRTQQAVLVMDQLGWTPASIAQLAVGVALPLREAIRMSQLDAPEGWPARAYELIRRPDLAQQIGFGRRKKPVLPKQALGAPFSTEAICESAKSGGAPKEIAVRPTSDAAPVPKATRFNEDRRLEEVARMLQYSDPVTISAGDRTLDQLTPQVQQSILTALSNRTLALPIGHAMFTYRSSTRPVVESVPISRINTSARILPMPSPVALVDKESRDTPSTSGSERFEWPEFHSGVAAALQLHPAQSGNLDSAQISFNKPADLDARHAGFLMGLGLIGRISALVFNQAFEYLKMKHDPTSIGLLLGLAVTYLGTGDPKVTSLLSVHLTALHPPNSSHLNVSGITQAAGLVGIGLLYLGTRRRTLADVMVRELCAIKVTSIEDPAACREAYALSAGFAFGLIMLASGTDSAATANEVALLRTFRALILGESNHPLPGATPSTNVTDVNITSSAGTIAVGLMYLRTERADVAHMLEIPDTARRLDYVRSDLLLLRTLARAMILWSSVASSKQWVESHIPQFIGDALRNPTAKIDGDLDIARWNIIAGACFGIGLKFAGTAAAEAHSTLIHYLDRLTRAAYIKANTVQGKIKRHAIRCCLSVVAIALSMVMAGTGEINVLRRLRVAHGHFSEGVTYGTHLASHMALGLLFVGAGHYTLGTSNAAIAALVIAFFPAFPPLPTENRAHLQAYRHLWTLAIEPRCLQVRDVDTHESTFLPIKLRLVEHADPARAKQLVAKQLVAPTLIPELRLIDTIQIDSPRYWSFALHLSTNPAHLASFLRDATIYVKRRTGHLSYAQDPRGIRSIFTRSKSETGSSVFDFGETAKMLAASATGLRDFVAAFSDDPEAIAAVAHLCHPAGSTAPPTAFEAFSASVLLECLTRDKRDTIAVYFALYHAHALLDLPSLTPSSILALEQLRLIDHFYRRGTYRAVFGRSRAKTSAGREPLLQLAFVEHLAQTLHARSNEHVQQTAPTVRAYLDRSAWPADLKEGRKLAVVLAVQDAPDVQSLGVLRELAKEMIERAEGSDVDLEAVLTLMVHGTGQAADEIGGRAWSQDFTALSVDVWMNGAEVV